MELSNLKVIYNNRFIKLFAVGVGNRSCSAVSKSKDISGFKILRSNPLILNPEGMNGSCLYFLTVYEDVDKYIRFFAEGSEDFLILTFARFRIGGVNKVAESLSFQLTYEKLSTLPIKPDLSQLAIAIQNTHSSASTQVLICCIQPYY